MSENTHHFIQISWLFSRQTHVTRDTKKTFGFACIGHGYKFSSICFAPSIHSLRIEILNVSELCVCICLKKSVFTLLACKFWRATRKQIIDFHRNYDIQYAHVDQLISSVSSKKLPIFFLFAYRYTYWSIVFFIRNPLTVLSHMIY